MSLMDQLAATLGDVDELLDDADALTITESLERGEAPDVAREVDTGCPWCLHDFHGLPCRPPLDAAPWFTGPWPCRCDSALTPLDDTWRPPITHDDPARLMHLTGLDGWSAPRLQEIQARAAWRPLMAAFSDIASELGVTFDSFGESIREMVESMPPGAIPVAVHLRRGDGRSAHRRIDMLGDHVEVHVTATPDAPLGRHTLVGSTDQDDLETPRARALRLQQERNTGPARPAAQHARRPRQHR